MTEDEMFGWHHQFNRQEFEQTLGDKEGQGSLACCSPWVTELNMIEQLNSNKDLHAWSLYSVGFSCKCAKQINSMKSLI